MISITTGTLTSLFIALFTVVNLTIGSTEVIAPSKVIEKGMLVAQAAFAFKPILMMYGIPAVSRG